MAIVKCFACGDLRPSPAIREKGEFGDDKEWRHLMERRFEEIESGTLSLSTLFPLYALCLSSRVGPMPWIWSALLSFSLRIILRYLAFLGKLKAANAKYIHGPWDWVLFLTARISAILNFLTLLKLKRRRWWIAMGKCFSAIWKVSSWRNLEKKNISESRYSSGNIWRQSENI